jgi:hypothetical protein
MADVPDALEYLALLMGVYDRWDAEWLKDAAKNRGYDLTDAGYRALERSCDAWWAAAPQTNKNNHRAREKLVNAKYDGMPECE